MYRSEPGTIEGLNPVSIQALKALKRARPYLTPQQYRTINGQILAGQTIQAMKGLDRLLKKRGGSVS